MTEAICEWCAGAGHDYQGETCEHCELDRLKADYARLEQECERWKETAAGLDRQNDAIAEEVSLALKRVDELRDLLRRISPHFSAPCGLGGLHAEIDAALSAKP